MFDEEKKEENIVIIAPKGYFPTRYICEKSNDLLKIRKPLTIEQKQIIEKYKKSCTKRYYIIIILYYSILL